jgi:LacI family transcriptional regulator
LEPKRDIVLAIGTIGHYGRGILRGAMRYMRGKLRWRLHTFHGQAGIGRQIDRIDPDGIIAQVSTLSWGQELIDRPVPMVNVSDAVPDVPRPQVTVDNDAVGRMAAEFFLDQGFGSVACLGMQEPLRYSRRRAESFLQPFQNQTQLRGKVYDGPDEIPRLLAEIDLPAAVFCVNDDLALELTEECSLRRIPVPEQLSVLGVNDDEMLCEISRPRLSSIQAPLEQIGAESARLLERQLRGLDVPDRTELAPVAVQIRDSTRTMPIGDEQVARALHFIRAQAHRPIGVPDVLDAVAVSRRTLEMRFQQILGRTPSAEIRKTHVDRARRLLRETDDSVAAIARRSGFANTARLAVVFKKLTGMTPSQYRSAARSGPRPE